MHLTRGHSNKSESFLIRNHKNQFQLDNQDYPLFKDSNTIVKDLRKNHKKSSSSEYAAKKFKNPFSTRYSSTKNQKLKQGCSKTRRFIEKEQNFAGSDINLERFNQDNFLRSPGSQKFDPNLSLFSFRDILPNSSCLEGNPQKSYDKFSSLKIVDLNPEFYKLRIRKSNGSGDHNIESKKNQELKKVLIPESKLENTSTSETESESLIDQKGLRRKREISYSSKPRSRKRRFTHRSRKMNRRDPSRIGRHQIIRLVRDQKAQNSTGKEPSKKKFENLISDQKNEDSVSRSDNQSPEEKKSKIDQKVENQGQFLMKNTQPAWQVQGVAPPIGQNQVLQTNQHKSLKNQENPNIHVFQNSQHLNSRSVLNKDQNEYLQNSYPVVAPSFPFQDTVSSSSSGQSQVQAISNILNLNSAFDLILPLKNNPILQKSPSVSSSLVNVNNLGNLNSGLFNLNLRNNNPNLISQGIDSKVNILNNRISPISNHNLPLQQFLLHQRGQRTFRPSSNNHFKLPNKNRNPSFGNSLLVQAPMTNNNL